MRIRSLRVQHFRALADLGPINTEPMCVVIGENDTGKTSLMLALQAFFETKKLADENDFFRRDTTVPVEIALTFDSVLSDSPARQYVDTKGNLRVQVCYKHNEDRTIKVFRKRPSDQNLAGFGGAVVAEKRKTLKDLGVIAGAESPDTKRCDALFGEYLAAHADTLTWVDDSPEQISEPVFRSIMPEFHFVPVNRQLADNMGITQRSLAGKLFLESLKTLLDTDQTKASLAAFKKQAESSVRQKVEKLQELLRYLTNNQDLALEHGFELDPLKGIDFDLKLSDSMVRDIPILNRGAGMQSTLLLAIFQLLAQSSASDFILAIEEPENSLHPRAQREMLWALQAISRSAQVIVSTHSPVFVDLSLFESNLFMTRGAEGATTTRSFQDKPALDLRNLLGVRPSDALMAGSGNCALIVEGETEHSLVPHLFELAGVPWRKLGVSIVPARGPTEQRVLSMVRILAGYGIPTVVVLDKDQGPLEEDLRKYCGVSGYESFRRVHRWSKGEIEDYLPLPLCVEVLNEQYPDGDEVLVTDICPDKPRLHELRRITFAKKSPGTRWSIGKVHFGELVGKKMVAQGVSLDEEIREVLAYVAGLADGPPAAAAARPRPPTGDTDSAPRVEQ